MATSLLTTTIGRARRTAVALAIIITVPTVAAEAARELPIAHVEIEGDAIPERSALVEILGLVEGQPIDRQKLRAAILAVYASGEVERIRVEATEADGALVVKVVASYRAKIAKIEVKTPNPVRKNQIRKWMGLQLGDPASFSSIEAGQRRALRKLRERGYSRSQIDVYVDYRRASNTVAITVEPRLGPVDTVGRVIVQGIEDPELRAAVTPDVKPDAGLGSRLQEKLRRQVEDQLRRRGYWEARVVNVEPRDGEAAPELVITVDPGPHFELELSSPPGTEKEVAAAFPDPVEEDIHPAQTDALEERIRENLQLKGHLMAKVEAELVMDGMSHVVRIEADPGHVQKVATVDFPGAEGVEVGILRDAVRVQRGKTTGWWGGNPISDSSLKADRRLVEQAYRELGYADVRVSDPIVESAGETEVRVLFPVDEGQRWMLSDVRIEGLPVEVAGALEQTRLAVEKATPWNPAVVTTAQRQLENILANNGYPEGKVSAEVNTPEPGVATVTFTIDPGNFAEIGDIVIAGLRKTRPSVVRRMLRAAGVESGAAFARNRMLDAQRRLYELGLFRTVELVPMPGQERRQVRGLVVLCEEGAQRSYLAGIGWNETDRFRLTLGWSHLNLFGGAHAFTAEARVSSAEERVQLGLREPRVPGLDTPGYLVVYRTFEQVANFTYEQRRRGLWVDVGDRNRIPFRTWYRYEYQFVNSDAPPNVLPRELQEAQISSITPTLEWDYRDDPLVPTHGTFSQISLEWAFPVFDADSEFLKLWGRSTIYGKHSHGTWAAGIRLGAIQPFGTASGKFQNRQIPLNTRYFAGGANTHRGFERDQLGIPVQTIDLEGNPIGGNALVLINLEYERPVTELFSAVAFVDIGNVWAEPKLVRLNQFRYAAGLGLRLNTAAGPLRAEYGWKLDREPYESKGEWFLSFGIPF